MLKIEPGAEVVAGTCDHCTKPMTRVAAFVHSDGDAHAVYYASCYDHEGHEVWIDAVFSPTWDDGVDDHVTFGCRIRRVGAAAPTRELVPAAAAWDDSAVFGHKLTPDEAAVHPRLGEFWALVDHVVANDPVVWAHIAGVEAAREQA